MTSKEKKTSSTVSLNEQLGATEEGLGSQMLDHPSYEELQNKLTETEKQSGEHWERLLRLQAEVDNTKRRVERDIENAHKFALEKFVSELLPVIDNLERAIAAHLGDESGADSLLDGVKLTLKSFQMALEKFGVEEVASMGAPFDPEFHQAVSTASPDATKPGTVIDVLQKGYLLNKRLVRPALVIVAK